MAHNVFKATRSKGERLGWTSLDKVTHVSLTSIVVRGRKIDVNQPSELSISAAGIKKLIIP